MSISRVFHEEICWQNVVALGKTCNFGVSRKNKFLCPYFQTLRPKIHEIRKILPKVFLVQEYTKTIDFVLKITTNQITKKK